MKKLLLIVVRWIFPLAIIGWLMVNAAQNDSFSRMRDAPKQWDLLALATVLCFAAVLLTIVRWYFLVRALEIPFRVRDAFRLGFLGYLYNFITPGSVGGDFFKAVFFARGNRGRRAEAAVTVIVDRLIGLYALFLVGTAAILLSGMWRMDSKEVHAVCAITFWCTGIGTAMIAITALPGFSQGPIARWLHTLPRVGPVIEGINRAKRMYYSRWSVLVVATVMSFGVHTLNSIGIWLIARGLLSQAPSLAAHFVVVPLAMATGALPLAPNGLGTFEFTVEFLYRNLPGGIAVGLSDGFLVALGYRLITVLIALVGVFIHVTSRREVTEVMHEAEAETEADAGQQNSVPPVAAMSL